MEHVVHCNCTSIWHRFWDSETSDLLAVNHDIFILFCICLPLGAPFEFYNNDYSFEKSIENSKNFDDTFSRFDTVPACDGQTDGQIDGRTELQLWHLPQIALYLIITYAAMQTYDVLMYWSVDGLCRRQEWTEAYLMLTGPIISFYKNEVAARKV